MAAVAGWKKSTLSFGLTKSKDQPLLGDKRTLLLHTSAWPGQAKHWEPRGQVQEEEP